MRASIVLLAVAALGFGARAYAEEPLIPVEIAFGENATKTKESKVGIGGVRKIHTIEEGEKKGRKYRFFHSDGSGTFSGDGQNDISYLRFPNGNWSVRCKKDVMDDSVSCGGTRGDFFVFYSRKTGYLVDLIGDKYPQSQISIRVDSGKPRYSGESSGFGVKQSSEILKSIKDGSRVTTRYVNWPHKSNVDKSSEMYGLDVVMDYLKWAVDSAM